MRTYQTVQKPTEEVVSVTCDVCGTECLIGREVVSVHIKQHWGWESHHDLELWEADICEKCVEATLSHVNFHKTTYLPI